MQGIYKITNLINDKCYIGKTNNSYRRWKDHQRLAVTPNHKEYDKALYQAMRKYGIENFEFEIIEELKDYSISREREKYWIQYFNSYNNGYNENLGGDGGSVKGHCSGSQNGRAKLTEQDVINIRTNFAKGMSKSECYKLYEDRISDSGFSRIWLGKTWTYIMPEVYTKENILRNEKLGKRIGGLKQRLYSNEEVYAIRLAKLQGMKRIDAINKFKKPNTSLKSFEDIWYNKTYKEVQIE